jgi:hypothetical protein
VGIDPTPSVMVTKGIALPEASNQHPRHIGKEYPYDKGNPLINFFVYHVIITLSLAPRLEPKRLLHYEQINHDYIDLAAETFDKLVSPKYNDTCEKEPAETHY